MVLASWDLYAAFFSGEDRASISFVTYTWSHTLFAVPWAIGTILGHILYPRRSGAGPRASYPALISIAVVFVIDLCIKLDPSAFPALATLVCVAGFIFGHFLWPQAYATLDKHENPA